ncbi:hypothetical protein [Methanooceanicella nereidis]|uniref:hypothetical protein n=1 Tax=Methanooceanicella nereidis TaxID=2052831 RepID=UPI001E5B4A55|nr:hypothetical protein [Methanocella sp. CWC-04]
MVSLVEMIIPVLALSCILVFYRNYQHTGNNIFKYFLLSVTFLSIPAMLPVLSIFYPLSEMLSYTILCMSMILCGASMFAASEWIRYVFQGAGEDDIL